MMKVCNLILFSYHILSRFLGQMLSYKLKGLALCYGCCPSVCLSHLSVCHGCAVAKQWEIWFRLLL